MRLNRKTLNWQWHETLCTKLPGNLIKKKLAFGYYEINKTKVTKDFSWFLQVCLLGYQVNENSYLNDKVVLIGFQSFSEFLKVLRNQQLSIISSGYKKKSCKSLCKLYFWNFNFLIFFFSYQMSIQNGPSNFNWDVNLNSEEF
jgi:hypothetical protein